MNRKELAIAVFREFPKSVIGFAILTYFAFLSLANAAGVAIADAMDAHAARNAMIASYDADKDAETAKADAADAEAARIIRWAADCRAANVKGTVLPANSCDVIQSAPEPTAIKTTADPDVSIVKPKTYLNWAYNARGESQAPLYLSAGNHADRAKEMLARYDFDGRYKLTKDYGYRLFEKVGERHGIIPSMLICIAKADTLLGKHKKSSYNIGNVGNNDRGHVVHYKDIGAGIDAIGKVLNGKYLAHKQSIGSLTPYGGGNAPFYATSPTGNWYNNVRNCLAEIYDNPNVGPDWIFRITK